jgi:hypothetical protein
MIAYVDASVLLRVALRQANASCQGDARHGAGDGGTRSRLSGLGDSALNRVVTFSTESRWLWRAMAGDRGSLGLMLVLCCGERGRFLE